MLRHQQLQQEDHDSRRASSRGIIPKAKVKTVKMTFVIVFGEFIIASHQAKPFFCFMKVFLLHHTGGKFLENGLKEEIQTLYHKNILTWHMQILCLR
jgi:Orotate phosphoribosyltransferase